jgi:hypothetical protein
MSCRKIKLPSRKRKGEINLEQPNNHEDTVRSNSIEKSCSQMEVASATFKDGSVMSLGEEIETEQERR